MNGRATASAIASTPAVSVLIATRNYAHFLGDAIRSVQRQTWTGWELILVDDGSTDETAEVVAPFLADPRIRYIKIDPSGIGAAKNLGPALARAPLLAFLDGDDAWLPGKLERQVRLLQAHPELGVVYTRRSLIGPNGEILPYEEPPLPRGSIFADLFISNTICNSSVLIRREVLEHVGGFDRRLELAVDYDLWLRVASHYRFDFIDEALVKYRTGHANLSKRQTDRLISVFSTMRRCQLRPAAAAALPRAARAQAWATTCRLLAFLYRVQEPFAGVRWYCQGWRYDRAVRATLRGVLVTLGDWLLCKAGIRRTRPHPAQEVAENRSENR